MNNAIKVAVISLVVLVSIGQPLSALESSSYYEEASNGDTQAQLLLSKAYLFGKDGFEKDLTKSLHWLEKSAEAGNKKAQLALAREYFIGRMFPQDKEKFVQLLIPLAHDDLAKAQVDLSDEYSLGQNIEKNSEQARYWLARAARLGESSAFYKLSLIYKNGVDIPKNFDKAWVMIREHAKANSPNDTSEQLKNIRKQCAFWHDPALRYTSINVQLSASSEVCDEPNWLPSKSEKSHSISNDIMAKEIIDEIISANESGKASTEQLQ